jgi:hypothetical protein
MIFWNRFGPLLVQYGFGFIVALFGVQMVREREIKWKQQMHMVKPQRPIVIFLRQENLFFSELMEVIIGECLLMVSFPSLP